MPSEFDQFASEFATPFLTEQFAERDSHGNFEKITCTLPSGKEVPLVGVIVGPLKPELQDNGFGEINSVETTWVDVEAKQFEGIDLPLAEETSFPLSKYPGAEFTVDDTNSDYGGAMIRVGLVRAPLVSRGDKRDRGNG